MRFIGEAALAAAIGFGVGFAMLVIFTAMAL